MKKGVGPISLTISLIIDTELLDEERVNEIKAELERAREDTSQLALIQSILTILHEHTNAPPPSKRTRFSPRA